MTCCTAHTTTKLCPQRHTCDLHRRYLEMQKNANGQISGKLKQLSSIWRGLTGWEIE